MNAKPDARRIRLCILISIVWLISVSHGSNTHAQSFTRVTDVGPIVTDQILSTGAAWNDINGDGFLDMFALGETQNLLYVNDGDGTFTAQTSGNFLTPEGVGNAALWADYNNDGFQDLFISNFVTMAGGTQLASNALFRNSGPPDYTLEMVNIGPELNASPSASWVDYDQDGDVDLFSAGARVEVGGEATGDLFYRQDAGGVFTRIEFLPFTALRPGVGTHDTWVDYDGDGDQDLFVVIWSSTNKLYKSLLEESGNPNRFDVVTTSGLTTDGAVSDIGSSWGDYDDDGDFDVFIPILSSSDRLYRNDGDGTFTRITSTPVTSGRSVMGVWGDADNDGDLDLYTGSRSPVLYVNDGNGGFEAVPASEDGDLSLPPPALQGGNWGDYDNDGDLDLFLLTYAIPANRDGSPQPNHLLRNDGGTANHWITIQCVGALSNRSAIGARVSVKRTVNGIPKWQHRMISGGTTSFVFHGDNRAHFGLGEASVVDSIRIAWPSGIEQVAVNEDVDQILTIVEEIPDGFSRANFYADQTAASGQSSLTVQFTDASLVDPNNQVVSWEWDLDGDGSNDAFIQNPTWTYSVSEDIAFSVRLTISNGVTSSTLLREEYITFEGVSTGADEQDAVLPQEIKLGQNYPNPFNPTTKIPISVRSTVDVQLNIYDVLGKRERRLFSGTLLPGTYSLSWDSTRDDGSHVASGMYLYELATSRGVKMYGRLMLVR
ncbi:MAG: T9SS type A sorting domain-containing protein [Rhodothermales bacterium]|nr:T9SS type A sorting domain-containing protein [Rhodothermales bacterium]